MLTFSNGVEEVIKRYVKQTTVERLNETFKLIANKDFIATISQYVEFEKIVYALSHYLDEMGANFN